ncbi:RfbB dTDP-D-glucose 4,6-dehydratase [Candidatus Pelagibacterales bacterium]
MKTVLVTGGLGFIGSNLIKILSKKKYFVINIDKVSYSSNYGNISKNIKNYKFYKLNINSKYLITKILNRYNPSIIFNAAAETHVDRSIDSPKEFIKSNILGVFNLLEAIRVYKKKIKLIHISTDEVYGDIKKNKKSKELDAYNPSSPYAASKASSDLIIKSYIRTYKLPAIITNCCNNFGPNQYPEKLIPTIIYKIINKEPIPIYGKGGNVREWIYVKDHCNALIKIAEKGIIGENYNIGSEVILNNIQIVNKIISIFKKITDTRNIKSKIHFVRDRPGHDLRYCLDSSKIRNKLKWRCKSNFDEKINETIIWYLNKFKTNYFKNKNFKNRIGLKI